MIELPSRATLTALARRLSVIGPLATIGFARALDDGRVSALFVDSYGLRECIVKTHELTESLRCRRGLTLPRQPHTSHSQDFRACENLGGWEEPR